jgi:hypothetical protein
MGRKRQSLRVVVGEDVKEELGVTMRLEKQLTVVEKGKQREEGERIL